MARGVYIRRKESHHTKQLVRTFPSGPEREYALFKMGLILHLPDRPNAAERVKPSLPLNDATSPDPSHIFTIFQRIIVSSDSSLRRVTMMFGSPPGKGRRSMETPITVKSWEGFWSLVALIFHPHKSIRRSQHSLPELATLVSSMMITSSTQCVAGSRKTRATITQNSGVP